MKQKQARRVTALLVSLAMILSLIPATGIAFAETAWDGTTITEPSVQGDVYMIGTPAELAWLAARVNDGTKKDAKVELTADIDLGDKAWTAIGTSTSRFQGIFDGAGFAIQNMAVTAGTAYAGGVFGVVDTGAAVKNLRDVTGTINSGANGTGGIVAWNAGGTVSSCTSSVNINFTSTSAKSYFGGVVGYNTANGRIKNCIYQGTLTAYNSNSGASHAGGIVGTTVSGTIAGCVNQGTVTGSAGTLATAVGGIVGRWEVTSPNWETQVYNCYNLGAVTADSSNANVGRITGIVNATSSQDATIFTMLNCFSSGAGSLIGKRTVNNPTLHMSNNYELASDTDLPNGKISQADLAKSDFVTVLNTPNTYGFTVDEDCAYIKGDDHPILKWQEPPLPDPEDVARLEAVKDAYKWGTLTPKFGTDTNLATYFKESLKHSDFEDVNAKLISVTRVTADRADSANIAANGDLTYFYWDPNTVHLSPINNMPFAQFDVTFKLSKGNATDTLTKRVNIYWNQNKVQQVMTDEILDQTTNDTIKAENSGTDQIISDLSLPHYLGGKGGKLWCEIQWTTDNSNILAIQAPTGSIDNQVYGPYRGVVKRGSQDQNVTLTGTFTFKRTNTDETVVVLTKAFPLTIKALGTDLIPEMQALLDHYYTSEKIKYSGSDQSMNPLSVDDDLQLLTAKNTGIPDYANYSFSAVSSNSDVLKINYYRGVVYRPLPGEAPDNVTLSITMTRNGTGLSVNKTFNMTVKPLTQVEIDRELQLMELAKTNYFEGIKGKNADRNHITGNLTPFQEVRFDNDGTELKWIYQNSETTGKGIVPVKVDLDSTSEAYSKFKSGDISHITHENLLVTQSQKNATVTIDSCLTSSTYEKYAEKYPMIEDFQALYRQPVSAVLTVSGTDPDDDKSTGTNPGDDQNAGTNPGDDKSTDLKKPGMPTSFRIVSTGYDSLKGSWDKVPNAMGYQVYKSDSKDGYYSLIETTEVSTFNEQRLTTGKAYYYKVKAYVRDDKKIITGDFSASIKGKAIPATPKLITKAKKKTDLLKWKKTDGATGYTIYRSIGKKNGKYKRIKTVSANITKYKIKGQKSGKTYYYQIRAYRMVDGKKVYSNRSNKVKVRIK